MTTEKENYLRTLAGEEPEWVPMYTFGPVPGLERPCPSCMLEPLIISEFRVNGGGKDIWGVNYIPTYETGNALLPEPNNFILEDITKWRDVIKAPDLEGVDWETMIKKQFDGFAELGVNRDDTAIALNLHFGYFENLMAFMGFTEGLCAMSEEPEEVYALFDYMCDFYTEVTRQVWSYVRPDVLVLMDDTAAWGAPFISKEMYHDLVLPFHDRQASFGRDAGIPITMHNCGKAEIFMEDLVGIGVKAWDPAQTCNDLKAVQEKFGNDLVIMGGWDTHELLGPDVTDDDIRQSVRDTMDAYAKGGGFCWCGAFLGAIDDETINHKNKVLFDEVFSYGDKFYK